MKAIRHRLALCLLATIASLAAMQPAQAGDSDRRASLPVLPKYAAECAACHIAYPPGLLPAASWQRVMNGLPRHYGVDASLDAATTAELAAWLQAHAGRGKRGGEAPPDDRITRSAWFIREHDEVGAATWKRASIQSPSRCGACHRRADQGEFNEHDVQIPR